MSSDVNEARKILAERALLRNAELAATERHLDRLREGRPETIETTSLHLDVLRDLRRIHSHICSVAYPVLDAAGELPIAQKRKNMVMFLPGRAFVSPVTNAKLDNNRIFPNWPDVGMDEIHRWRGIAVESGTGFSWSSKMLDAGYRGIVRLTALGNETGGLSMIDGISAVTLGTHEMPRAVRFYRALGFEILHGGEESSFTSFRAGASYLNLIAQPAERRWSWWGRVIFYVADVDELYDRALAAGCQPTTAPRDAEWGERFFHLVDPDGHELSFARLLRSSV